MKKLKALIIFLILAHVAVAQFPAVTIPGSEIRKLTSSIVAGQEYELQVLLPGGHKTDNKKYPVVYIMDAQWDFPLLKSIYGQQYYDGFIPEMIMVGVTWGGINPNPDSLRVRDYTPTNDGRQAQSGHADKFLQALKDEIFPFIEENYKADPANRTLVGCSLGGLFTIYTMLTHTDMFNGYAAASPAVSWDREVLYKYEQEFAKKQITKPIRLYMTVGDVERSRPAFVKFGNFLSNKTYTNVSIKSKILENTGHSGTKSETYNRGLQFIFEKPKMSLSNDVLNRYAGTYRFPNGNTFDVRNENYQLTVAFTNGPVYRLYAASETVFYSDSEFFNLLFKIENNTITALDVMRYNNTQPARKIK